jgi:glycosyltransferase involved in cell wall biosynthesis
MAVNYANGLAQRIEFSGLVATRAEGSLKSQVAPDVSYFFLGKRYALDPRAVRRLRRYCIDHRVGIIHAHSTSYFLAILVRISLAMRVRIIWHDHNGNSEFLDARDAVPLNVASYLFKGIIVVNTQLKEWALRVLHCPNIVYIPNFTQPDSGKNPQTTLLGTPGKRILLLANLREQKDHFTLLEAAGSLRTSHPDWTFHLVGKDFLDDYSANVKAAIAAKGLQDNVILYGSRIDTSHIIAQADICVLSSKSEGLPVALLEYGVAGKPVVVTNVGEIPLIVANRENGLLVPRKDGVAFAAAVSELIADPESRAAMGASLRKTVVEHHTEDAALRKYLEWLTQTVYG